MGSHELMQRSSRSPFDEMRIHLRGEVAQVLGATESKGGLGGCRLFNEETGRGFSLSIRMTNQGRLTLHVTILDGEGERDSLKTEIHLVSARLESINPEDGIVVFVDESKTRLTVSRQGEIRLLQTGPKRQD